MKYYHLFYVYWNNGESGACGTYDIAQSADKSKIDKIIADNKLEVVSKLERGQSNVFVLQEFEPNFPEYFKQDMLDAALEEEKQRKEDDEFISKASDELFRDLWGEKVSNE